MINLALGLSFLYLEEKKNFYNCMVKKKKFYSNYGYACNDCIFLLCAYYLYNSFYGKCLYNGFSIDCFL